MPVSAPELISRPAQGRLSPLINAASTGSCIVGGSVHCRIRRDDPKARQASAPEIEREIFQFGTMSSFSPTGCDGADHAPTRKPTLGGGPLDSPKAAPPRYPSALRAILACSGRSAEERLQCNCGDQDDRDSVRHSRSVRTDHLRAPPPPPPPPPPPRSSGWRESRRRDRHKHEYASDDAAKRRSKRSYAPIRRRTAARPTSSRAVGCPTLSFRHKGSAHRNRNLRHSTARRQPEIEKPLSRAILDNRFATQSAPSGDQNQLL